MLLMRHPLLKKVQRFPSNGDPGEEGVAAEEEVREVVFFSVSKHNF
jgi:hypothetical protein